MSFLNLPQELRALPQWVVYRSVIRGEDIVKPPFRLDDPTTGASVHDPSGWGTFDQAVAVYEANRSVLSGVGFMLTESDPYVVIDVDKIEKVPESHLGFRHEFEKQILALGTYTELSPSGRGMHAWLRGRIPMAGKHLKGVGSEVYAWQRFITCTGKPVGQANAGGIVNGQDFLHMVGLGDAAPDVVLADDPSKPMDLTDYELYQQACQFVSTFYPRFHGQLGCDQGEWSHTFVAVVGVLDKLTGSVAQVVRMMQQSPMVVSCPPAMSGETRVNKCKRTIYDVLARVRRGNRASGYFVEHGRQVWHVILAEQERRAAENLAETRKLMVEAGKLSAKASGLLDFFPMLNGNEHRKLTVPPGITGEFVQATLAKSAAPYLKFAIPATLSALSGITGRGYKTASGGGINVNFILAAPSSTGKTQSQKAWESFVSDAAKLLPQIPGQEPVQRILNASANSIQGIMHDFEEAPSCAWFIEECQSQLTSMSKASSPSETALRDSYNTLYDCATHTSNFSVPRSVASRNANIKPIQNLSVSTYWTTTTSKFDVFTDDALDGFLSRVIVIRHTGRAGDLQQHTQNLPPHLAQYLSERMVQANAIDQQYRMSGPNRMLDAVVEGYLIRTDQSQVVGLDWELVLRCEAIKNAALEGNLPPTYTAASRLPQTAMRIAALLAIMENPWSPSVTPAQLKWAFGYLLLNVVSLLSDMDSGELGQGTGDDWATIVRTYRDLLGKPEYKDSPGVPRNVLFQHAKGLKPFSNHPLGRSKAVTNTLAHMLTEGAMDEIVPATGQRGRPTKYLVPVRDHQAWG